MSEDKYNLGRFLTAQRQDYDQALREIRSGRKQSHWIWYIFPQLKDLGFSSTAKYYGIRDLDEAKAYLQEPTLNTRLIEISKALLMLNENDPETVMGHPDDLKLRSSMTLFAAADPDEPIFSQILDKFFQGKADERTLDLIRKSSMNSTCYIASCVFTSQFPELSARIQDYIRERWNFRVVRCCVPKYKLQEFTDKMPEGNFRKAWAALPDSGCFESGDSVYSLCHNCNNIIEEMHPGVSVHSLWELIDQDDRFCFPDHSGLTVTLQDCWRAKDRADEQNAVRNLLGKMNIQYIEAPNNHERTDFCGNSLYRPQPPRNPKLAPRHYVDGTEGLFQPHTIDEQNKIMKEYCSRYTTETVVCYCHYCLEGLKNGGKDGRHLAHLLFP